LYGDIWSNFFPIEKQVSNNNFTFTTCDFLTCKSFIEENYVSVYGEELSNSPFLTSGMSDNKEAFYQTAGDFFVILDQKKVIGILIGNAEDWESYYLRYTLLLREYQELSLYQILLNQLISALQAGGISRIRADASPANLINVHLLNKFQFNIIGFQNSERWGSIINFVKFLKKENESVFLKQFCWGIRPQLKIEST